MSKEDDPNTETAEDFSESEEHGRSRLETLIPSLVKKAISQGVEVLSDEKLRERVVQEVVRKAIDKGGEVVDVTEDSIRRVLSELQSGKEFTDKVLNKLDDIKIDAGNAIRDEISNFLASVEMNQEIQKVLNGMVVDVHTQVRFKFDEREDDEDSADGSSGDAEPQ